MIHKGAQINKRSLTFEKAISLVQTATEDLDKTHSHEETDLSMLDILKVEYQLLSKQTLINIHTQFVMLQSDSLRRRLLIMCVNWVAVVLCYNGLSYNSVNLEGNIYANMALGALIEIPSYLFCVFTFDRFGRRPVLLLSHVLTWLPCLLALVTPSSLGSWAPVTLATVAKFGCAIAYTVVFLMVRILGMNSVLVYRR